MHLVAVLDTNKQPLAPTTPRRARLLLKHGKAAVFKRYPFTIILKHEVVQPALPALRLKLDPGSITTGIALLDERTGQVIAAAELQHRGQQIHDAMLARRSLRRNRRQRKTRYRAARFNNRRRSRGWLPPSLQSRVENIVTWINRLRRSYPISAISVELARFDTQALVNPEIAGVAYQQGELAGYEVRQYLFLKWGHRCAYCGAAGEDVRLEVEHLTPRSRGGSDRVSNLCIACQACNLRKGNQTAAEFGYPDVERSAQASLKDAAAVNTTRWALYERLKATGLPVEVGTGGRTSYNRARLGLPKAHWIDAACAGASTPERLDVQGVRPLQIIAKGHGNRQMCGTDKYGIPVRHRERAKDFMGWQTGDIVDAHIPTGKYAGRYRGRLTIRQRPMFKVGRVDVHPSYLRRIQRADGYAYEHGAYEPTKLDKSPKPL